MITIWDLLNELWKLTKARGNAALSLLGDRRHRATRELDRGIDVGRAQLRG
ncbi:MAG: hypothetical protein AAB339_04060 [Elusimicrobiota bacterium]